jgi:hypothetical protein
MKEIDTASEPLDTNSVFTWLIAWEKFTGSSRHKSFMSHVNCVHIQLQKYCNSNHPNIFWPIRRYRKMEEWLALKEAMHYLGSRKHKYHILPRKPILIQFSLYNFCPQKSIPMFTPHSLVYQMAFLHKNSVGIYCFPLWAICLNNHNIFDSTILRISDELSKVHHYVLAVFFWADMWVMYEVMYGKKQVMWLLQRHCGREQLRPCYNSYTFYGPRFSYQTLCWEWSGLNTWTLIFSIHHCAIGARSCVVEAPCYKPENRGFDSRCGHWIFQLT